MRRLGLILLAVLVAGGALSSEPELAKQALDGVEREARAGWAYTMTVIENGEERVERFDPSKSGGSSWSLIRVEGRRPSEKDLEDYEDVRKRRERNDNGTSIRQMVMPGTMKLLREAGGQAVYSFEVRGRDERDQKMMDYVDAMLYVDVAGPRVERLELKSSEPFSPFPGVKVDSFDMIIRYVPLADGPVAPDRIETRVRGRAFLVKAIDSDVRIVFSEYRYVGE